MVRLTLALGTLILLLGAAAPPGPSAALQAGQVLERAGRLAEAEVEYRKAMESETPALRLQAAHSFNRVVNARENLPSRWTSSGRALLREAVERLAWPILLLVGFYLAVRLLQLGGWLGKNRLEIRTWSAAGTSLPSEHFQGIVTTILYRMKPRVGMLLIEDSKLPILTQAWNEYVGAVAELVPGTTGKWLGWFLRLLRRPEYSVGGSLRVANKVANVVVYLERFGSTVEVWEDICPERDALERVKDFVYLALIAIKKGRGRSHALGNA